MSIRRASAALILAFAFCAAASAQDQEPLPAPDDLATALQQKYDRIRDFTADFTHLYAGGVLKRKATERGTVAVKKPARMRWDYTTPEKKLFLSDGRQIYLYVPADKQVMVSPVPAEDQATSAVLFLMGKGNLTRDFTVRYADAQTPDTYVLRLDPKVRQAEYDWLELAVDRRTLQIRRLTAADVQGATNTFEFANFKENVGMSDKTFEFTIPRGTDVIKTGQTR